MFSCSEADRADRCFRAPPRTDALAVSTARSLDLRPASLAPRRQRRIPRAAFSVLAAVAAATTHPGERRNRDALAAHRGVAGRNRGESDSSFDVDMDILWRVVPNEANERRAVNAARSRRDPPCHGHFQFPLAEPLVGILARERVRPLVGDGADLADLVAATPQVGSDGCVASANLGGQFAQQYIVHEGTLSPPLLRFRLLRRRVPLS